MGATPEKEESKMKRSLKIFLVSLCAAAAATIAIAGNSEKDEMDARQGREKIDLETKSTLERLFAENESAKALYDKAYGYAVFDNLKLSLFISGGGGKGVAVEKESGKRTYMNMGTAGLNLGLGGQKYQVVFLFELKDKFDDFVDKGWQADASANAVAGKSGANVGARFVNGMAIYQFTEAGLMLQADIAGTKYWKNDNLNKYPEEESAAEKATEVDKKDD